MTEPYYEDPLQQKCTVGPFDSYHSNVVNRLTQLVSNNQNCIFSGDKIDVTQIGSTNTVEVSAGTLFKDDVFIKLIQIKTVDMEDSTYYIGDQYWNEAGYYYITIHYVYEKARPAPRPDLRILLPSQRGSHFITGDYVLLKVIRVVVSGSSFAISSLLDSDPEISANKRIYSMLYFGLADAVPAFDLARDYGRVIQNRGDNKIWYGTLTGWVDLTTGGGGGANPLDVWQLARDMYITPALNGTGVGILSLNLETQILNLRDYVGAVNEFDFDPAYISPTTIVQGVDLTIAASQLDAETQFVRNYIGKTAKGSGMPVYSSTNIITPAINLTTATSQLDDVMEKLKTYTGKPDNTGTLPPYTSVTTIGGTNLTSAASALDLEGSRIRTFIGKTISGVQTPIYSTVLPHTLTTITDGTPLRTAIATLDLSLGYSNLSKVENTTSPTPSILLSGKVCGLIRFENGGATLVTNIIDAPVSVSNSGFLLVLQFANSNTTIINNANIVLCNGSNFVGTNGSVLTLARYGGVWYEVSRAAPEGVYQPVPVARAIRSSIEHLHPQVFRLSTQDTGFAVWLDISHTPHRLWFILLCPDTVHYRNFDAPLGRQQFGLSESGITVELSGCTLERAIFSAWRYDNLNLGQLDVSKYYNNTSIPSLTTLAPTRKILRSWQDPTEFTLVGDWVAYGDNAYGGEHVSNDDCFEWISTSKFGVGIDGGADCFFVELSGDSDNTIVTIEVVWRKGDSAGSPGIGNALSSIFLGQRMIAAGWGSYQSILKFNLRGQVFEI